MQLPTNYKMGTGLAATIMGQQAGLEAEQQGLANVIKGMQMPAEALKGQEAAMLMQNPEYLQQKVQNTMIDLRNQYSAADFQETLNSANRIGIELDAAGGDPAKEQQIVDKALTALKIDPRSEFAQYARRDPRGALTKFKQGVETSMIGAQGGKHLADMEKERFSQGEQTKRTQLEVDQRDRAANLSASTQRYTADKTADYRDVTALNAQLGITARDITATQAQITKLVTEDGRNEAINDLIASQGLSKAQATSQVNSGAHKKELEGRLAGYKRQYEHLQKQSPYFKGFDFGNNTPAPTSDGLPAGVVRTNAPPAAAPAAAPAVTPESTSVATPAPQAAAPAAPVQQPTSNPALGRVFGNPQAAANTPSMGANRGYVPTTTYNQYQHDKNASRKQAQTDQANREVLEATLEVNKWSSRTDYPYGRAKLKEAEAMLAQAQQKLNSLQ